MEFTAKISRPFYNKLYSEERIWRPMELNLSDLHRPVKTENISNPLFHPYFDPFHKFSTPPINYNWNYLHAYYNYYSSQMRKQSKVVESLSTDCCNEEQAKLNKAVQNNSNIDQKLWKSTVEDKNVTNSKNNFGLVLKKTCYYVCTVEITFQ